MRGCWNMLAAHGAAWRRLRVVGSSLRYPRRRAALSTWVLHVAELRARYDLFRRSAAALRHAGLRWSLNSLMATASEARDARGRLRKAATGLRGGRKRGCWNTLAAHGAARRRLRVVGSSLQFPQRRAALSTWIFHVAELRARHDAFRRSTAALRHAGLRWSLNSLMATASEARDARGRLRKAATGLRGGRKRGCWNTLAAHGAARRRLRVVGSSLQFPQRRAALSTWIFHVAELRARHDAFRRSTAALRHAGLRWSLNSLMATASEAHDNRRRLRKAATEWRGGRVRVCWLAWRHLYTRVHSNSDFISVAVRRIRFARCYASFRLLATGSVTRRRRAEVCSGARRTRRLRNRSTSFRVWVRSTAGRLPRS